MRRAHYSHGRAAVGRAGAARRRLLAGLLAAVLATGASGAAAETVLHGRVVHIRDAAQFTVQAGDGRRVHVRLAGTLAPAPGTAAAAKARRVLAELVFDQPVEVRAEDAAAEPLVARVFGSGVDVAMQMVAEGWLRADGSDAVLVTLESEARGRRRGQWAGASP